MVRPAGIRILCPSFIGSSSSSFYLILLNQGRFSDCVEEKIVMNGVFVTLLVVICW